MPGEDGVHDLRHDGVVVADDAWEQRTAVTEAVDQVRTEFVADAAMWQASGAHGFAKRAEGAG